MLKEPPELRPSTALFAKWMYTCIAWNYEALGRRVL
jgi:hypothetical protein